MGLPRILKTYYLAGLTVNFMILASGRSWMLRSKAGRHSTDELDETLQRSTDDDSLITAVEKSPLTTYHRSPSLSHITALSNPVESKMMSLGRALDKRIRHKLKNVPKEYPTSLSHDKTLFREHFKKASVKDFRQNDNAKTFVSRQSREESADDVEDDGEIQSKTEDDDEDVELIVIPKKRRKHLQAKVSEEEDDDEDDANRKPTEPEDEDDEAENINGSVNFDSDPENPPNDSHTSYYNSDPTRHRAQNSRKTDGKSVASVESPQLSSQDDATLTLERVTSADAGHVADKDDGDDEYDEDSEDHHRSRAQSDDYDLHLRVKDTRGTTVKLAGDLPGNIGNLVAEGEQGGRVQIKNTKVKDHTAVNDEKLRDNDEDATTDEIARRLIKVKSGKLRQSPYPSNILLKLSESTSATPGANAGSDLGNTVPAPNVLKSFPSEEMDKETKEDANQQPSSNIFEPMEFENGDDELIATSRLLDIAQRADDASSLKEIKDPSNTVKEPSKSLKQSRGLALGQKSKTFFKTSPLTSEVYKNIDEEANDNWYKLQSLEDRVINEGSSARTGKDVGSFNGQKVSVVTPSQIQLLQTEYPSYPVYLTPLIRTKVGDN